jgi:hypothetical protein
MQTVVRQTATDRLSHDGLSHMGAKEGQHHRAEQGLDESANTICNVIKLEYGQQGPVLCVTSRM